MEPKTLVELYRDYTARMEAPTRFHTHVLFAIFGHALGRRVFVQQQGEVFTYPGQIMTLLVGPTGMKKTSAMAVGTSLLEDARRRLIDQTRINVMSERLSTEAMIEDLVPMDGDDTRLAEDEVDCSGLLLAPEMSSTFGNQGYMEEMTPVLTRLADASSGAYDPVTRRIQPYYWRKFYKKDGVRRFRNPTVALIGATTPTSLRDDLPAHVRTTGFLARLLTVFERRSDRPADPLLQEVDQARQVLRTRLVQGLARAANLEGEARLTKDAVAWMSSWYPKVRLRAEHESNQLVAGFLNRAQGHVLRLGTILMAMEVVSAKEEPRRLFLDARHLDMAAKQIMRIARDLPEAYGLLTKDRLEHIEQVVLQILQKHKHRGIRRQHLQTTVMQQTRAGKVLLEPVLNQLIELRVIGVRKQRQMQHWTYHLRKRKPGPFTGQPAPDDSDPGEEYWENDAMEAPRHWEVEDSDPVLAALAEEEARRREREENGEE